ncbi:CopG family transcriptional regulator [Paenibacillus septentrionalis]|uniref:CopG family transcriptional regulator n=1 Tax=Paenibacillus septentrionalis TaxID=429342 RepID=A0ABW1V701_9BACL
MPKDKINVRVSNKDGQLGFVFTRGGLRQGSGRKGIGVTKKVSLTLSEELWDNIENYRTEHRLSRSEALRNIIESYYAK